MRCVAHAEVGLQALEGAAVGRVHGAAAAVAAGSHRVGDGRVHSQRTVGQFKRLVKDIPVRAHMLVHVAERYLDDWVLEGRKHGNTQCGTQILSSCQGASKE